MPHIDGMAMAHYQKPSKVNLVSVTVVLLIGAAIYAVIQFGPAYWRSFQAQEVLGNAVSNFMLRSSPNGEISDVALEDLRRSTEQQLHQLGIEDAAIRVRFIRNSGQVTARAEYQEVVRHPLGHKVTIMHFDPSVTRRFRK